MSVRMKEKTNTIKLPLIHAKTNEVMTTVKQRPQSQSNEQITDLQKNLFSKLQSVEHREGKTYKKRKPSAQSCKEINVEQMPAFNRLQKLAPQLYMRLAKIQKGQHNTANLSQQVVRQKVKGNTKILRSTQMNSTVPSNFTEDPYFVTDYGSNQIAVVQHYSEATEEVADQEMERIYTQYLQQSGLKRQTMSKQLKQLNDAFTKDQASVQNMTQDLQQMLSQAKMFISSYAQ